ncbi:RNA-binding protein [Sulfolobus sp. E5-1-F]|uniref:YhbY family RNA-binding protein n=1 Tax=Sulfolobaceae TaxID=118883 RepID=UPI0012955FE9|nr:MULTISPECIES: YhbY family RNA-binding protein [unclassified Sulfolobus]QGA53394.1 RNA-binding protein [Sulfolobus sp. E5-1-F]QGA68498.1 RNA-binding protein [Sulfolobus sp. E11-6]
MYSQEIKDLIKKIRAERADIRIGKYGVTEGMINEIKRRLNEHKVIKVKIGIKEIDDRKEFAKRVAEMVGAKLIEVRGYTFILAKVDSSRQDKD